MSNPDTSEQRLQSWSPRQPSERVARELFETGTAKRRSRSGAPYRFELWNWLTPVAACCLTVIVLCSNSSRRASQSESRDNATYFATLMLNAAASNTASQTFALRKGDENIEWNVWPHATLRTTNFSFAQQELRPVSNSINGIYP